MKNKTRKRILSALLTVSMLLTLLPISVLADGEGVTVTAGYGDDAGLWQVTAVDEEEITLTIDVTKNQTAGATLSIALPYGVDLVSAPGISAVSSSGGLTLRDSYSGSYGDYFSGDPDAISWTPNTPLASTYGSSNTVATASGTLIYDLKAVSGFEFEMKVKVNSLYVPLAEDGRELTTDLGNVVVTLTEADSDPIDDYVNIQATAQAPELAFSSLTVREYASDALDVLNSWDSSYIKTNLMEGNVNTVKLSASFFINDPFDSINTAQWANYPYFYLTVPADAEVVATNENNHTVNQQTDDDGNLIDVWKITLNGDIFNFGTDHKITRTDFVTVTLPEEEVVEDAVFDFEVSGLVVPMHNVYDATTTSFSEVEYMPITDEADTLTASIEVIGYDKIYDLGINPSSQEYFSAYNNYYEAGEDSYADYIDAVVDQTLVSFYRIFDTVSQADRPTTDTNISLDPVKMTFTASQVDPDGDEGELDPVYLDFVNKVNFVVPYIGADAPRQSSELLSLTVTTEVYGEKTEENIYATNSTKTYTFSADDIANFMEDVAENGSSAIGTQYNFGYDGIAIGSSGIVEYYWNSAGSYSPMFIVQAPTGESIVSIEAEFSGDTNSFLRSATDYGFKAYGYPKDPTITYFYEDENSINQGVRSLYTFEVTQDADADETRDDGDDYETDILIKTYGFLWEAPVTFNFTVTETSTSSLSYMYNNAEANFSWGTDNTSKGVFGYQVLGAIKVANDTGALPKENIVATAEIDTEHGDVVKEIYFPYSTDTNAPTTVVSLTYSLASAPGTTITASASDYELFSTYGLLTAPDGDSFASFEVELDGWTNKTTESIFQLQGYLKDSNELIAGDVADAHTLSIATETTRALATADETGATPAATSIAVDTTFYSNTESFAGMRVLDTTQTPIVGTTEETANVLIPGVETDIQVMLFGGEHQDSTNSSWHDIVFTVVLPDTITLNSISVDNFTMEHASSATNIQYVDTGETVSDLVQIGEIDLSDAGTYFTEKLGTVEGATAYQYKLSDEDLILYWTRYSNDTYSSHGDYDSRTNFTVTMNVTADLEAADLAVAWEDVLILGTSDSKISSFKAITDSSTKGYVTYDGQTVSNTALTGTQAEAYSTNTNLATGTTTNVVVGSSTKYLFIDQDPKVMVQNAHIEMSDGSTYTYSSGNSDSVAVFGPDATGTLHFSILDTVSDTVAGTNYVLMPLPTAASTNGLQSTADFGVTINDISFTATDSDAAYEWQYVTIDNDTTLNSSGIAGLYNPDSTATSGNAILIAITSQKQFSTINVEVDFTVPDHTTEDATDQIEYVYFSGMVSYYLTSSTQKLYYGGYMADQDSANNFVKFGYSYPVWNITYQGMTVDSEGTNEYTLTDYSPTYTTVNDNGSLAVPSSDPTPPTGYTFEGWFTDEDLEDEMTTSITIIEDTTLYAKFEEGSYYVKYTYEDTFTGVPADVTEDVNWTEALDLLDGADRTGYTFLGWYDDETLIPENTVFNTLSASIDVNDTVTLTGKYTATTYTVTYNLNGGTGTIEDNPKSYAWDADFSFPIETVTKAGYDFDGWGTTSTAVKAEALTETSPYSAMDFAAVDTTNVNLYAIWTEKTYTVSFDTDGADTDTPNSFDISWTGTFSSLPALPTKDGYSCDGWFYDTTEVFSTDTYMNRIGVENATTITLKAVWIAETYQITFDDQDGDDGTTNKVRDVDYDGYVTIPNTPPTRDGYTFKGWYTTANSWNDGGTQVTNDTLYSSIVASAGDITVYANWEAITYSITFTNPDGGTVTSTLPNNITDATWDGESFTLADPTGITEGWKFLHWDWDDGTTDSTSHHPITVEDGDTYGSTIGTHTTATSVTLIAHYEQTEYTVSFDLGVADYSKTAFKIGWDNALVLDEVDIPGYTFNGWYADSSYTTPVTSGTTTLNFLYDTYETTAYTIYAKYTQNQYTVTYDLDDGALPSGTAESQTFTWSQTGITLPTPEKDGAVFAGWYEDEDCIEELVTTSSEKTYGATFGSDFGVASTTQGEEYLYTGTLYAKWTANSYKVSYNLNGGSSTTGVPATETLGWNDTITDVATIGLSKTGYTFVGWNTDYEADEKLTLSTYAALAGSDSTSSVTLYAIWTPIQYTVSYDSQGGTPNAIADVDVYYNATFTPTTTVVTKTGYTFVNWYTGENGVGTAADTNTYSELFGATDVTLFAYWTNKAYTISFLNTGAGTDPTASGNWSDVIVVATPTKTGYKFAGWYATDADNPTSADAIDITSNVTLFSDILDNDDTSTLSLRAWWTENTPSVQVNYSDELLTNMVPHGKYTINGVEYTADSNGYIAIEEAWLGTTLSIIRVSEYAYTFDSDAFSLTLDGRPTAPYSTLSDAVTYTGAQAFELKCEDDLTIYYYIVEHNDDGDGDDYVLVDDFEYDSTHTYSMKETSQLVIYTVDANGLKSDEVIYDYVIEPNLTVSYAEGVSASTPMITAINSSNEDNNDWINDSTLSNFGLIRIDDEDATDDDIVTDAERDLLNEAMPSGYSEVSAFQLHATVNDEVILDTVELSSRVTIVIELDSMSTRKTYQVLHMKHNADDSDDVEIFTTDSADANLLLTADYTAKTLTLSVDSLSPFMVVSKTTSTSSSSSSTSSVAVLDTENHFAYMQGYADGTFRPDNNITRAQAIVMFSRLLTEQMDSDTTYTSSFSDVTSDLWYANAVGYMEQYGIITGYSDGTFRGDSYITRAQFAAIASRFDALDTTGELPFSDVDESHWASDYISSASIKGWITGYTDGTFRPDQYITRAQAVTMVNRVLERSCDETFVADNLDDLITYYDVSDSYWAYYNILEATNGHDYTISDGVETWTELK